MHLTGESFKGGLAGGTMFSLMVIFIEPEVKVRIKFGQSGGCAIGKKTTPYGFKPPFNLSLLM